MNETILIKYCFLGRKRIEWVLKDILQSHDHISLEDKRADQ